MTIWLILLAIAALIFLLDIGSASEDRVSLVIKDFLILLLVLKVITLI